jgi:pilus assembly protein CpaC
MGHDASGRHTALEVLLGRALILETPFAVQRVALGNAEIADVVIVDPNQLNIVPLQMGATNLVLWGQDGRVAAAIDIQVGSSHARLEREMRRILENETLSLEGNHGAIVLKGTVEGPIQMQHTLDVVSALQAAQPGLSGEDMPGGPKQEVVNLLKIGGNQQVMIEVIVAEMDRNLTRRLGTNLAGVYKSGGTDVNLLSLLQGLTRLESTQAPQLLDISSRVNFISTISRGSDSLDVFIEAVQSSGLIKILAEPNLVARSGESAEFLVGGEVPIPIPQGGTFGAITVEFKPFGVGVQFTPTVLTSNKIYINVSTEVSEPNNSLGLETGGLKVPGFNTRRVATAVELRDGESFAIAGLLRDDVVENLSEFPGLGDIPILGALFRSTQFVRKQTELVIIATPRLIVPGPTGRPHLPTDHFVIPTAVEFFLDGSLEAKPDVENEEKVPQPLANLTWPEPEPQPVDEAQGHARPAHEGEPSSSRAAVSADSFAGALGHSLNLQGAEGELQ